MHDPRLRGHKVLLFLVSFLIAFSLVFVRSMTDGIAKKYALLGGGDLSVEGTLESVPEGAEASVVRTSSALLYGADGKTRTVAVKGVGEGYFDGQRKEALALWENAEGTSTLHPLVLSSLVAEDLGLKPGDKCLIVFPKDGSFRPVLSFVSAIYSTGYRDFDASLVFCDEKTLEPYGYPARTEILVEKGKEERVRSLLEAEGRSVSSWYDENDAIARNLVTSQRVILLMFIVVVLLAAWFSGEFASTLVEERKKTFATLKLIGAGNRDLVRILLCAVSRISVLWTILGMAAGIALSYALIPLLPLIAGKGIPALSYYLLDFRPDIPWGELCGMLLLLLLASILTSLASFARVGRVSPVLLCQGQE